MRVPGIPVICGSAARLLRGKRPNTWRRIAGAEGCERGRSPNHDGTAVPAAVPVPDLVRCGELPEMDGPSRLGEADGAEEQPLAHAATDGRHPRLGHRAHRGAAWREDRVEQR